MLRKLFAHPAMAFYAICLFALIASCVALVLSGHDDIAPIVALGGMFFIVLGFSCYALWLSIRDRGR